MSSAALVGTDGSIDWCCFPRFDSPSVFAAILDPDVGGHFRIAPATPTTDTQQAYVGDTNVLRTTFTTEGGVVSLTDFMPAQHDDDDNPDTPPKADDEIHRIVSCESGEVELVCDFQPRHDYARAATTFEAQRGRSGAYAVRARGGRQTMTLGRDCAAAVRFARRPLALYAAAGADGNLRAGIRQRAGGRRGTLPHPGKSWPLPPVTGRALCRAWATSACGAIRWCGRFSRCT